MDKNPNFLPFIIVVAGIVIGASIYFVHVGPASTPGQNAGAIRPVTSADHIVGNPGADFVVVEYSDADCEYCKQFQQSMEQLMTDYGPDGNVAWVYRHFPLRQTDPSAPQHAEAAECVASLGGSSAFFKFIDAMQAESPGATQFDPSGYGAIVDSLGLSMADFQSCIDGTKFEKRVADDYANALSAGAVGAPFSVLLIKGHDPVAVSGSLPYAGLKKVIDTALLRAKEPAN